MKDLQVGSVIGTEHHFIAVSIEDSETLTKPITKQKLMALKFHRDDIPWLMEALQKELDLIEESTVPEQQATA